MLKKLAANWNEIKQSSEKHYINRKVWCKFSFDRKEPTLKIYDNTSFIELNPRDIDDLRNYLNSLAE